LEVMKGEDSATYTGRADATFSRLQQQGV